MKKKIITLLLVICFMFPCALMFTACGEDPIFNGYEIYINGAKTNEFSCVSGESAITADDITIKSSWSDESLNKEIPFSEFEISVEWRDKWGGQQTEMPAFWTNGTGATDNDYATTYAFTLILKSDPVWTLDFDVNISPIIVTDCSVTIFDGTEYRDSVEMVWGHNDRETDSEKHIKLSIANLDDGYNQREHIQWALIEKDVYDSLKTTAQKIAYFASEWRFGVISNSNGTGIIDSDVVPGTYYAFVYIPDDNNKKYGEYGDGIIYDYATLIVKPIELAQTQETHSLQHSNWGESKNDFTYFSFSTNDEISATVEGDFSNNISTQPYGYVNGNWSVIDRYESNGSGGTKNKSIKVHAVLTADGYKMVDLKDIDTSKHEWAFVNSDGSYGDDVADNSAIVLIDYKDLAIYKNTISITIPTYYMVDETSSQGVYFDCSKLYRTEVKIWKYAVTPLPNVNLDSSEYVTGTNTFEFAYGFQIEVDAYGTMWGPKEIMESVLTVSSSTCYYFEGFDQTEASEDPHYGYVRLESPHYAWRLDGVNYTSDPLVITYYIHPAEVI